MNHFFFFVSGVVLANASLDIAFHDIFFVVLFEIIIGSFLWMYKV